MSIISFSLFGFDTMAAKAWAFSQMGLARPAIARMPQIGFHKLMGTGSGAGFSTRPNFGVYSLLAEWPDLDRARASMDAAPIMQAYRQRAGRSVTLYVEPIASRGSWSGHHFATAKKPSPSQELPVVALTRATIRPSKALQFWSLVPAISDRAEADRHRLFMIGTGEVPWLHQVTFSIWDDIDAMVDFAHKSATHGAAVRQAYDNNWFSEYCFLRFNIRAMDGRWPGLDADRLGLNRDKTEAGIQMTKGAA